MMNSSVCSNRRRSKSSAGNDKRYSLFNSSVKIISQGKRTRARKIKTTHSESIKRNKSWRWWNRKEGTQVSHQREEKNVAKWIKLRCINHDGWESSWTRGDACLNDWRHKEGQSYYGGGNPTRKRKSWGNASGGSPNEELDCWKT